MTRLTEIEHQIAKREQQPYRRRPGGPGLRPSRIVAGTPDAEAHTHKTPQGEGVPVEKIAPPAKPEPAKAAPPGPAPAAVAAEKGVAPVDPTRTNVPRETQGATPAPAAAQPEQPKDMHAFYYRNQVEAMERELMARGRVEDAAMVRTRYNQLIDGQYRSMETEYKTNTLPKVQAIQTQLLNHQGKQLPAQLAMEARQTTMQAAQQQQQMLGYLYGLARNDATKGMAIQYFNESELIEPGLKVADVVVDEKTGMLTGIDAQGQVVKLSSGEDFAFPVDALEQLYKDLYESGKEDYIKLGKDEKLVDRYGRKIADNPERASGTQSETLSSVKAGGDVIATAFGAKMDPVSRMIDPDSIKDQAGYTQALAEMETLVRQGVPPMQAANQVAQKYRAAQGANPAAGATPSYDGPLPWRQ